MNSLADQVQENEVAGTKMATALTAAGFDFWQVTGMARAYAVTKSSHVKGPPGNYEGTMANFFRNEAVHCLSNGQGYHARWNAFMCGVYSALKA